MNDEEEDDGEGFSLLANLQPVAEFNESLNPLRNIMNMQKEQEDEEDFSLVNRL